MRNILVLLPFLKMQIDTISRHLRLDKLGSLISEEKLPIFVYLWFNLFSIITIDADQNKDFFLIISEKIHFSFWKKLYLFASKILAHNMTKVKNGRKMNICLKVVRFTKYFKFSKIWFKMFNLFCNNISIYLKISQSKLHFAHN